MTPVPFEKTAVRVVEAPRVIVAAATVKLVIAGAGTTVSVVCALLCCRVAVRLSHQLVRLLNQVGRRVNGAIEIRLSREELAQLTGTTLFTVSRLLSDWNDRGIVSTRRESVSVRNFQALARLAESE